MKKTKEAQKKKMVDDHFKEVQLQNTFETDRSNSHRGGDLSFDVSRDGRGPLDLGEEGPIDYDAYNWGAITSLTLVSILSGFCFGYDTAVIAGATLFFENDFPDITKT